ncbi:hypothetical protein RB653_006764 [Dictyostelium firmibasis]|uniref:Uncharacterized protein n=1 Tax=Dictyostelium firmibasis TaxID=79012 RepID=A0AAN7YQG3_9MYCE
MISNNIIRVSKLKNISNKYFKHSINNDTNKNNIIVVSSQTKRLYGSSSTSPHLDEEVDSKKKQQVPSITSSPSTATPSILDIPTASIPPKPKCWCVLSCKLLGKRIESSQIKPIKYEDERAIILQHHQQQQSDTTLTSQSHYKLDLNLPLSASRKQLIKEMILAKDQYVMEQKQEEDKEKERLEKEKEKENKQLFQTDDNGEERDFPVLTGDDTSIGPIHILYKNQWISTIVERIEPQNKDNEPSFILKIKTPIKLSSEFTFSFESIHSTLDRLLTSGKIKADCEFDKIFITTVDNDRKKEFTNWINTNNTNETNNADNIRKCLLLKEALTRLKTELLPSIGFNDCSIDLVLSKDSIVGCKEGRANLEFPDGTYQLVLEIDSNEESIWAKCPESVEKILYLYTMMLDSIVSMGHTNDVPLPVSYL